MNKLANVIYRFGGDRNEGKRKMKDILGGKGANLAEMSSIGLPVPPGFTISTEVCRLYTNGIQSWPDGLEAQVEKGLDHIEKITGGGFGGGDNPLLVSVRSGAAESMPGMMDTVLNLGLNRETVEALARKTENRRFAIDSYRRFIKMFGNVVRHIPNKKFEEVFDQYKTEQQIKNEGSFTPEFLEELVRRYKTVYRENTGQEFPENPKKQLKLAVRAVFESWHTPRAKKYRQINDITGLKGTAVTVQAMVFGNMGVKSATGVCFTRNPSDGSNQLYGEFLPNAQGEDVVAGIRTPKDLVELDELMPDRYKQLQRVSKALEKHYNNMQDIEFTIQENRLYLLQTRDGKRTGRAAIKIATDMVEEGLITQKEAVEYMVEPSHLDQLLHPQLDVNQVDENKILGKGLPASPGAAVGTVVFNSNTAEKSAKNGDPVILVRVETSPDDVAGMSAAEGVLTSRGGMTSHASVVARGWGKPCVTGCGDIAIDYGTNSFTNGDITINEGDWISLDGTKGVVIRGQSELISPTLNKDYEVFMEWVDHYSNMEVRANADSPDDAARAKSFGAEGIGLCRTEHMFFEKGRISTVRKMIIAEDQEKRDKALKELQPLQRQDFVKIFEAMEGSPVTIRLLDPPFHEFLPAGPEEIEHAAGSMGLTAEELAEKISSFKEHNPMLGHRGCRLGITFPEITKMQTRAIIEAAINLKKEGRQVLPEIMVPLISTVEEFVNQQRHIKEIVEEVVEEQKQSVNFKIGTMIETPRAALVADEVAEHADFFSFGTNDLTQMTFGFSRDDASKFIPSYIGNDILSDDPFEVLDKKGVGKLVSWAVKNGREVKPELKMGVCGEHGGEPKSIQFFHQQGLNYVSCSPFRVPIARLTAAQENLRQTSRIEP